MTIYRDSLGYYHDKPCVDGKPSSNNCLIYTAYAKVLGLEVPKIIFNISNLDLNSDFKVKRVNTSDKNPPPFSKDEFIGYVSLTRRTSFVSRTWNFSKYHKITNLFQTIKDLFRIRNEHRNYVWQNKVYSVYPIAFSVPYKMRYFAQVYCDIPVNYLYMIAFYFGVLTTMLFSSSGSKNILWLQLKLLKNPLHRLINHKKHIVNYFGKNHIFSKKVLDS